MSCSKAIRPVAVATLDHARWLLAEHMLLDAARRTISCGAHYRDAAPASIWREYAVAANT